MDVETVQLLNLSPIPELSELELSTMMEQLSGLSDINGDFTDQHVENIIKKAEDLLDKSSCNQKSELNSSNTSESEDNKSLDSNQHSNKAVKHAEYDIQELHLSDGQYFNTPINSDHLLKNECYEGGANKHFNSPVEQIPSKVFSPGGSCNHIKSTIDSLKEFSTMIEKQLSNKSPNLSPKYCKPLRHNDMCGQSGEMPVLNFVEIERYSNSGVSQQQELVSKKNLSEAHDKSVKLLNCFERLYQSRPVRLLACKKAKPVEKVPKAVTKKKLTKDLKNTFKHTKKKLLEDSIMNSANENIYQNISYPFPRSSASKENLNSNKTSSECISVSDFTSASDTKTTESKSINPLVVPNMRSYPCTRDSQTNAPSVIQATIDEKLILKVLEEVEQIKDQVRKAGLSPEKPPAEEQGVIDNLKSEVESVRERVTSVSNAGIRRLQEQFSLLKFKYYQQMDKLEAENMKLRKALHCQQKFFAARRNSVTPQEKVAGGSEACFLPENGSQQTSVGSSPSSCDAADNKAGSEVSGNVLQASESKEAFCQTEKETNSVGTQWSPDVAEEGKKETEARKTENKENVTLKYAKGVARSKPFSDVGIQQLTRQKKLLDHESQLLATLRGLQTEMTAKEKENRKLKTEIESLRKQLKKQEKQVNSKVENCRKVQTGTQTIGLGPCAQRPYTPETFEVRKEFERENEDLRLRIRALEEDFELLKEKRITDLQSLHQVHEKEMEKLVSKLETQSSLTKHLHSLLINR